MVQLSLAPVVNERLFSKHFLEERIKSLPEWQEDERVKVAYGEIKEIYDEKKEVIVTYTDNEAQLEKDFIRPVLEALNHIFAVQETTHKRAKRPDYAFFESKNVMNKAFENKDSCDFYKRAIAVGDAKAWDKDLDKKIGGKDIFENQNPSYQIDFYLRVTPPDWGILTNGRKWRLYFEGSPQPIGTYYEVDLVDILEKDDFENFKYFYLFFRRDAFIPLGDSFLDRVYNQSIRYAGEIGENLEDNVYKSLLWMAKGYFNMKTNQLEKTEENIKEVHENSLIFLYRLLFLFYVESKGMLGTEVPRKYAREYSFTRWVEDILNDIDNDRVNPKGGLYNHRLFSIFRLVREGSEALGILREEFRIPAYNGGLFDNEKHPFLRDKKIQDGHIAKVVDLLARVPSKEHEGRGRIDYSDLSLRHLGGIYEGLLEYKLKLADQEMVAVKEDGTLKWIPASKAKRDFPGFGEDKRARKGELYLVTDKGERKATGSYYTLDYIVKYIVENTLGPVIEEKLKDTATNEEKRGAILSTKVLDPAMGSGHFLVEAVDFLANELVKYVEDGGEERDIDWAKREVARNDIYGVDVNPLATELAKVSLWLNTMAEDKPLSFLDHHLKTGNSLVGADIHELDRHPEDLGEGIKTKGKSGQLVLSDFFGRGVRDDIKELLGVYKDMLKIAEERPEDIKEQEELFREFEAHPFKKKFDVLSDVQTGYHFGNEFSKNQYEKLLEAFRAGSREWEGITREEWVKKASDSVPEKIEENLSDEKRFFHWKLEFPEVFFDIRKGLEKKNPGFDVVVGNPPYGASFSSDEKSYIKENFCFGSGDSAEAFIDHSHDFLRHGGRFGMIVPKTMAFYVSWGSIREKLHSPNIVLQRVCDAGLAFPDVNLEMIISISQKDSLKKIEMPIDVANPVKKYKDPKNIVSDGIVSLEIPKINNVILFRGLNTQQNKLLKKLSTDFKKIRELNFSVFRGLYIPNETKKKILGQGDKWVDKVPHVSEYVVEQLSRANLSHNPEWGEKLNKMGVTRVILKVLRGSKLKAAVVDSSTFTTEKLVNVVPPEETPFDVYSLCGIFNSQLASFYMQSAIFSNTTETARVMDEDYIGQLPLPLKRSDKPQNELDSLSRLVKDLIDKKRSRLKETGEFLKYLSREWNVDIEELARKSYLKEYWKHGFDKNRKSILNIAKHNSSKIKGNPSSRKFQEKLEKEWRASVDKLKPLVKDIHDLENQVDALVFRLYELDEEEIKVVLGSLGTEEELKQDILDRFQEIGT